MPKKKKRTSPQDKTLEALRGGKPVPRDVVRASIAEVLEQRGAQRERRHATEGRMARLLGRAQGLKRSAARDPRVAAGQDGLLALHKRLAKQKVAAPKIAAGVGGLLPGRITVNVTPPFDYDIVLHSVLAGDKPTLSATSDRQTGKMELSAVSLATPGFNGGSMYTTVGAYFHPFASGTLTLHASPVISFQWWTNSLNTNAQVRSFGQVGLTVYGIDVAGQTTGETGSIVSTAGTSLLSWDETKAGEVHFDFQFDVQKTGSVQLPVTHTLVYLLFVDADVHVEGMGWPGSIAGAKLGVTVPSLTYDFDIQPVLTQ